MEASYILSGLIAIAAVVSAIIWVRSRKEETIFDYQKGLLFHKGRFTRLLDAGAYQVSRKDDYVVRIDTRPVLYAVPGQEILTRDKISIKVTAAGTYSIVDARLAFSAAQSYHATLYSDAQGVLRDIVQACELEALLGDRGEINAALHAALAARVGVIGLELRDFAIRDLMLPAGLKKAFGGLLEAQKEAQIAVEKARGEQAVLRSLANSSRLYAEHPSLLSARLVQALDAGTHTLVFNADGDKPVIAPAKTTRKK